MDYIIYDGQNVDDVITFGGAENFLATKFSLRLLAGDVTLRPGQMIIKYPDGRLVAA